MDTMKGLLVKYREVVTYGITGVLTTIINYLVYFACSYGIISHHPQKTLLSTAIAWCVAVLFAYVTNRIWVFRSQAKGMAAIAVELGKFMAARIASGVLDAGIMYLCVDVLGYNDLIIKVLSNVLVIILNYAVSKLFIFRNA